MYAMYAMLRRTGVDSHLPILFDLQSSGLEVSLACGRTELAARGWLQPATPCAEPGWHLGPLLPSEKILAGSSAQGPAAWQQMAKIQGA